MLPVAGARSDQVERVLKTRFQEVQKLKKELDLLIVILPDNNGSLYGMESICNILILIFALS